ICINGIQIKEPLEWPVENEDAYDEPPGIPPEATKYSTLEEAGKWREPIDNHTYIYAAQCYFYTHCKLDKALEKTVEYIKSLPYVKSFTKASVGGWLLETYSGETRNIVIGSNFRMKPMNRMWGPDGTGPPSKKDLIEKLNYKIKMYSDNLLYGNVYLFYTSGSSKEIFIPANQTPIILPNIVEIVKQNVPDSVKIKKLLSIGLFNSYQIQQAQDLINNFVINSQFDQRVHEFNNEKKQQPVYHKKNKNDDLNYNEHKIDNKEKDISQPGINKNLKSTMISYSPDGNAVYVACPYTYDPAFAFDNEKNLLWNAVFHQNYNLLVVLRDDTEDDNNAGYSYSQFKEMKNADILYFTAHGSEVDYGGVPIVLLPCSTNVKDWSNDDPLIIPTEITEIEDWASCLLCDPPTEHPWAGVAASAWVEANWKQELTQRKSIVFLGICNSYNLGWGTACGGGVTFSYNGDTWASTTYNHLDRLFNRMNGTIGNGNYRTAGDAYDNMVHNNLQINPSNTAITLCPAPKDGYSPASGDNVSDEGDGYFEVDTYCDASITLNPTGSNSPLYFTSSPAGVVSITNLVWDNSPYSNKITYHWKNTSDAAAVVTVHVNTDKFQSYGTDGNSDGYHILDFNGITPNGELGASYSFTCASSPVLNAAFSADNTNISVGGTVTFINLSTGSPTAWQWSFQGGTPSSSTQQNPAVTYYTAGTYDVSLTVSAGTESDTETKPGYINVSQGSQGDITISGNVKDGNFNSNLAGITVQANYDDGSLANSAITDDNGNFEFFVDYYWTGDVIALGGSSYGNQSIHLTEVISNKNLQFYLYGVSLSILKTQLSGNYYEFKAIGAPIYTESYTWNFGDGSFPETSSLWWRNYYYSCSQTLTYNYTVTLSILTESGQTFNASLPVTIEPCPAVTSGVYYGDECSTFRMGSTATILDLSSPFSDINYLGIWWGEGDVEYWDTESGSQHGTNPEHFMYIANCREFEHLFNSAGHYNVSLTAYNSAEQGNAIYLGFNIVDCSVQITNSYLWGSVIDHWNNAYYEWAGSYNLSTFDPRLYSIGFPSILDENIYVGACDEIVLNDGVTIEPAVGKEIVFYIDECLQGSDNKNMQIADNDRPQHETKCLTSEEHENIIQNYNNDVIIYPNPNNGIFMLSFTNPGTKIKQLEIFNSLGQLILKNNNIVKHNYLVDISRNNCGIYYVKILYENKTDIFKVAYSIIN
ncbi:MAG: PKD domain-containing protein, partial [Bacteroidia bacterium]|nr:PKD domain-containing protein [Bacteroidia bacterium]